MKQLICVSIDKFNKLVDRQTDKFDLVEASELINDESSCKEHLPTGQAAMSRSPEIACASLCRSNEQLPSTTVCILWEQQC